MKLFRALVPLVLAAGCGGPDLRVETLPPVPGVAYFKPVRDGQGNEYPQNTPETAIGAVPTSWAIPPALLGGHGYVRVDFGGGRDPGVVYDFAIFKDKDTVVRLAPPPVVK